MWLSARKRKAVCVVVARVEDILAEKFKWLWPHLNERQHRLEAAADACAIGHGGVASVARASGLSRPPIAELDKDPLPTNHVRRQGAGRKRFAELDPELPEALESLVDRLAESAVPRTLQRRWCTCALTPAPP